MLRNIHHSSNQMILGVDGAVPTGLKQTNITYDYSMNMVEQANGENSEHSNNYLDYSAAEAGINLILGSQLDANVGMYFTGPNYFNIANLYNTRNTFGLAVDVSFRSNNSRFYIDGKMRFGSPVDKQGDEAKKAVKGLLKLKYRISKNINAFCSVAPNLLNLYSSYDGTDQTAFNNYIFTGGVNYIKQEFNVSILYNSLNTYTSYQGDIELSSGSYLSLSSQLMLKQNIFVQFNASGGISNGEENPYNLELLISQQESKCGISCGVTVFRDYHFTTTQGGIKVAFNKNIKGVATIRIDATLHRAIQEVSSLKGQWNARIIKNINF